MAYKVHSQRLLKKRRKRFIWRMIFIVAGTIFIIVGPIMFLRMQFWQISTVNVSGNIAVASTTIENLVQADISGDYAFVFPKSNILFYPKHAIETDILKIFSRIESVKVSTSGLRSISVAVNERTPTATWCQDISCYLMDKNGYIFDTAPEFNSSTTLKYEGSINGGPIGAEYTSPEEFALIVSLVDGIKALSLTPVLVNAIGSKDYEVTLSGGEVITLSIGAPVNQTLSNLASLLSDPKLSLRSGTGLSVSSLDLRYDNKVYFIRKK